MEDKSISFEAEERRFLKELDEGKFKPRHPLKQTRSIGTEEQIGERDLKAYKEYLKSDAAREFLEGKSF